MSSRARENRTPFFPRSFRKTYPLAVRGEGVYLWDINGKRYMDFCGSAAVSFIGHGDQQVIGTMSAQGAQLEFVHTTEFLTPVAEALAAEVLEFAGPAFAGGAVQFTCGGSESVEVAMKLARQYQVECGRARRYRIVGQHQSYHGATLGAIAVSGNIQRRKIYLDMVRDFGQVSIPYCYRCSYQCDGCAEKYAGELADLLDEVGEETAGFIFEPVSGATLGAAVPPDGYLRRISEICSQHDVLLIADEVMTGFGRTGRNFAVEHWDVAPDILVIAKGIGSGYAPLGAVVANRRVVDAIANGSGAFTHGFTYNAHPIALAAGRAVMNRIRADALVQRAATLGPFMHDNLETLRDCRSVGDVRGIGLLWGLEFVADKHTKQPYPEDAQFAVRVSAACTERGLSVYPIQGCVDGYSGDHLLLAPPAVITEYEIACAVTQMRAAIQQVESQ